MKSKKVEQSPGETTAGISLLLQNKPLLIGVGAAVAVIVLIFVAYNTFFSTRRAILAEVEAGQLVRPTGSSAYDLFQEFLRSNPSSSDIRSIAEAAVSPLERRGDEIISTLKEKSLEHEQDWQEAIRIYAWLNQLVPDRRYQSKEAFCRGRLAFMKGQNLDARRFYEESVGADSSWALPHNSLARVFIRLDDKSTAAEYYKKAIQAEPSWIFPWLNLGALYYQTKDYSTAEEYLLGALRLDANRPFAHYYLGLTLDKLGRHCDAVRTIEKAIENAYSVDSPGFSVDSARKVKDQISRRYGC